MAAARKADRPGVGSGNWRSAELPDNVVTCSILGQWRTVAEAAAAIGATATTVYGWCRKGRVLAADSACRLAAACEPKSAAKQLALVRALAGLKD